MVSSKTKLTKSFLYCLLALTFLFSTAVPGRPLLAAEASTAAVELPDTIALTPSGGPALIDDDQYMSEADQISLSVQAAALGEQYKIDLILAIITQGTGADVNENAQNILNQDGYSGDAILCLIDLGEGMVWLTASGKGANFLSYESAGEIAQYMIDENDFSQAEYAGAFTTFLSNIRQAMIDYETATTTTTTTSQAPVTETTLTEETTTEATSTVAPTPTPEPTLARDLLPKKNNTTAIIANTPSGAPALLDPQNYLSPEQQSRLSEKALALAQKYGLDVVLVIMDINTGQSAQQNAEDIFDYGGYGQDGVLGLIDIDNRTVWVSTTGKGMELISDAQATKIAEKVVARNRLKNYAYEVAMDTLAYQIEDKLADSRPRVKVMDVLIALLAAALAFGIFFGSTSVIYRKPKGAKRVIDMKTQAIPNYDVIQDTLVNTYTRSEQISSGSSGGGSRSSGGGGGGGRSHGGGGASW